MSELMWLEPEELIAMVAEGSSELERALAQKLREALVVLAELEAAYDT
jgi:hypothetical protein